MIQFIFDELNYFHRMEAKNLRKRENWLKKRAARLILKGPHRQFIFKASINVECEKSLISAKVKWANKIHALARGNTERARVRVQHLGWGPFSGDDERKTLGQFWGIP